MPRYAERDGALSILNADYLIATKDETSHFREKHVMGLFTRCQMEGSFRTSGFDVEYDAVGFMNRGLYVARPL